MAVFILVLVLLVLVSLVVASPWRRVPGVGGERRSQELRSAEATLGDLLAARDAKYQEIRDAVLDRQTGKLSDADFAGVDASLRAEAVEILRALDRAQARVERLRRRQGEDGEGGESGRGSGEGADGAGESQAGEDPAPQDAATASSLAVGGATRRASAGSAAN